LASSFADIITQMSQDVSPVNGFWCLDFFIFFLNAFVSVDSEIAHWKKRWGYKGFWRDHIWCLRHSSAQHLVALIKLSHALTYGRIVWKWFMIVSSVYQSMAIACSKATTRTFIFSCCCYCLSPYSYWHVDAHLFAAYHAWRASSSSHKIG
jgi:hypothetical protein